VGPPGAAGRVLRTYGAPRAGGTTREDTAVRFQGARWNPGAPPRSRADTRRPGGWAGQRLVRGRAEVRLPEWRRSPTRAPHSRGPVPGRRGGQEAGEGGEGVRGSTLVGRFRGHYRPDRCILGRRPGAGSEAFRLVTPEPGLEVGGSHARTGPPPGQGAIAARRSMTLLAPPLAPSPLRSRSTPRSGPPHHPGASPSRRPRPYRLALGPTVASMRPVPVSATPALGYGRRAC